MKAFGKVQQEVGGGTKQLILINCGSVFANLPTLPQFVCNFRIDLHCTFTVICVHVQSCENFEKPSAHIPS